MGGRSPGHGPARASQLRWRLQAWAAWTSGMAVAAAEAPRPAAHASGAGLCSLLPWSASPFPALHRRVRVRAAVLGGAAARIKCESISFRKRHGPAPAVRRGSGIDGDAQPAAHRPGQERTQHGAGEAVQQYRHIRHGRPRHRAGCSPRNRPTAAMARTARRRPPRAADWRWPARPAPAAAAAGRRHPGRWRTGAGPGHGRRTPARPGSRSPP